MANHSTPGGRLADKATIVTGAGAGIGRATAHRFAEEGARVACVDIDGDAAASVAEEINRRAGDSRAIACTTDVTDVAATEEMASTTLRAFGRIDAVFANAGIAGAGTAMSTEMDLWDRVIAVNLTGVWLTMRAALPTMVEQRSGSLILQASAAGVVGVHGIFPYAAAKAGVVGMARQAALDFGRHNVRVNAIAPGTARTGLVDRTYGQRSKVTDGDDLRSEDVEEQLSDEQLERRIQEGLERARQSYPMQRLGTVDEIANVALFLASDEASWVTGSTYSVDGGLAAA